MTTTTTQPSRPAVDPARAPSAPASSVREDFATLLRNGPFRTLVIAHFASNVGDWLAFMALFSVAAFDWQANVAGVSVLAVSYMLPFATVAPLAGVFVDRWELRRVMVASDLIRAALVACMAWAPSLPIMCVLLFLHQSVSSFFNPALHASIPRLVEPRHILAANSLDTQAAHLTKVLGPGVAGIFVAALGARGCFLVDAATFALSALLLMRLPLLRAAAPRRDRVSVARDLRSGVMFLLRHARLRSITGMLSLSLCGFGAFVVVLPIFARDVLGAGSRMLGLLLSGLGVGALVGAVLVAHSGKRWDKPVSMIAGSLLGALALALLANTHHVGYAAAATILLGVALASLLVPALALLQEETPRELLARVMSLVVTVTALAQVGGMAAASVAAERIGIERVMAAIAIVLCTSGVSLALLWGVVRVRREHGA